VLIGYTERPAGLTLPYHIALNTSDMAAAQASQEDLQRKISELCTCAICFEDLQNAKALPCLHTFCLKCLEEWSKDKAAGQGVQCPVCRKLFDVPPKGVDSLDNNFFIQTLVDIGTVSSDVGNISNQYSDGNRCDKHPNKRLEQFCLECQVTLCRKCQVANHRQHKCQEIETVAKGFAKSLEDATSSVQLRIEEFQAALEQQEIEDWQTQVAAKTVDISTKQHGEKLKNIVDGQVGELLNELGGMKVSEKEEARSRRSALELAVSEMQNFAASSLELRTKGSPCDVLCRARDLQDRAGHLLETFVTPAGDQVSPDISFMPMNIDELTRDGQNLVGRLRRDCEPGKSLVSCHINKLNRIITY